MPHEGKAQALACSACRLRQARSFSAPQVGGSGGGFWGGAWGRLYPLLSSLHQPMLATISKLAPPEWDLEHGTGLANQVETIWEASTRVHATASA